MTCSQNEQEHDGRCCMKCSKGTYVSNHCKQKPNDTQCAKCSHGFYTENSNYIDKCLTCRTCYANHHLQISKPCTTESNTKCKCMEGFYCTGTYDDHCVECKPITRCPPGQGVSVPSNSTHDTVCEPCPQGTFNNKNDYITQCRNHTSCLDLRRHFISHGTAKTDAQCGDFESRCHWMIPASLWAGLILTLILVVIGGVCLKYKRKRKGVITLVSSENFIPPALPPDVIKYPRSPELQLQTLTHNSKSTHTHTHTHTHTQNELVSGSSRCSESGTGSPAVTSVSGSSRREIHKKEKKTRRFVQNQSLISQLSNSFLISNQTKNSPAQKN